MVSLVVVCSYSSFMARRFALVFLMLKSISLRSYSDSLIRSSSFCYTWSSRRAFSASSFYLRSENSSSIFCLSLRWLSTVDSFYTWSKMMFSFFFNSSSYLSTSYLISFSFANSYSTFAYSSACTFNSKSCIVFSELLLWSCICLRSSFLFSLSSFNCAINSLIKFAS